MVVTKINCKHTLYQWFNTSYLNTCVITVIGMVTAVGLSNLRFVDMNSSRNLFVLGLSLMMGLSIPNWMATNKDLIKTGKA